MSNGCHTDLPQGMYMAPEVITDAVEQQHLGAIDMWAAGVMLQQSSKKAHQEAYLQHLYTSIIILRKVPAPDRKEREHISE